MNDNRYLRIYMRDHLAMARAGIEFLERVARENQGHPVGRELAEIAREVEEERPVVEAVLERLEIEASQLKNMGAWVAEKFGRLKLNGEVIAYSPLSRVYEIEGLMAMVEARYGFWKTVEEAKRLYPALKGITAEVLASRAKGHQVRLEELHQEARREMLAQPRG